MNRLRWFALLLTLVILVITGFQVYWLRDNYKREERSLEVRANILFRETVEQLRDSMMREKLDKALTDTIATAALSKIDNAIQKKPVSVRKATSKELRAIGYARTTERTGPPPDMTRVIKLLEKKLGDSLRKKTGSGQVLISLNSRSMESGDSNTHSFINIDSLNPDRIREVVVMNPAVKARRASADSQEFPGSIHTRPLQQRSADFVRRRKSDDDTTIAGVANTLVFNNEGGQRIIIRMDSLLVDTLPEAALRSNFTAVLRKDKLDVPFTLLRNNPDSTDEEEGPRFLTRTRSHYKMQLGDTVSFLLKRISLPILFSVFLVGITVLSLVLLYRSLVKQHRLAQIKNDLISNITHELKTPIATVGVAIEALKNFNAINDKARTEEYLTISQHELQRLGLLVDKVLKLSMFESREIELKQEPVDLRAVVDEVVASLRLQAEKYSAHISVESSGDTVVPADRLHLLSVVFNLLDNALKYSRQNPVIAVSLQGNEQNLVLRVSDNGIGIPSAYTQKIFEKFFRVPAGDTHNAKGHGLGLSYVAGVVRQHGGSIEVDSREGEGSIFTITLPK